MNFELSTFAFPSLEVTRVAEIMVRDIHICMCVSMCIFVYVYYIYIYI